MDDRSLSATWGRRCRARAALADELLGHEPIESARGEQRMWVGQDEHDRHFGVVRVRGDSGAIFLSSLLVSYLDMLDDVERGGTSLSQAQWTDLLRVPKLIFDFAARRPALAAGGNDVPVPVGRGELLPQRRWDVGHRLFFTLLQTMTQMVASLSGAARAGDEADAREFVELLRLTTLGCTASLRLTADFSIVDYELGVRPTMLPPHVRPGFSGLQTRDHYRLLQALRKLQVDMPTVIPLGEPHAELIAAVRGLHDAHAYVCTRFGGATGPSLRMAALGQSAVKGVEALRGLARRRELLLAPPPTMTSRAHPLSGEDGHD